MGKLLNQGKSFGRETESGKPISTNSDAYAALISMIFDLNCLADQFLLCVDERQKSGKENNYSRYNSKDNDTSNATSRISSFRCGTMVFEYIFDQPC